MSIQLDKYVFKKATIKDFDKVFEIFQNAISTMRNYGIEQWDELYPDKDILAEDISKKQMTVVLQENKIAAVYVLSEECDEEYKYGNWSFPDAHFCVIHRLCVNPDFQHKGIARMCVLHIEEECKQNGYETIRLDSFTQNPFAQKLYNNLGYDVVGHVEFRKGIFELREKKI